MKEIRVSIIDRNTLKLLEDAKAGDIINLATLTTVDKDNIDNNGNDVVQGFLDHSFLIDYYVLDSISNSKREQKKQLSKYAIVMLSEEIKKIVDLLLSCGIKITEEEIMKLVAQELKDDKSDRLVGADDVKKKFKSAMDEYIERTQEYL